jgi:hypothetical protein
MGCTTWVHSPRNVIFALLVLALMSPQNYLITSVAVSGRDSLFDTGTVLIVVNGTYHIALLWTHLPDLHSGTVQSLYKILCTPLGHAYFA